MGYKIIPLIPNINQKFSCTLPIDSKNITLSFTFTYNSIGNYWFMSISDGAKLLIDAVPLVTGEYPAANLLEQYEYLGIGSAAVIPTSSIATDMPDETNFGTEYVLVWGDTIVS